MIKSFTPHQQYDEPSAKLQTFFCNPVANPAMLPFSIASSISIECVDVGSAY